MNWLFKEEPTHYSYDDLVKDGKTLAEIKAKAFFKDFPLVCISRLSVMPVTDDEWSQIEKMASR